MSDHDRDVIHADLDLLLSGAHAFPRGTAEDAPTPTPLGWAADATVVEPNAAE